MLEPPKGKHSLETIDIVNIDTTLLHTILFNKIYFHDLFYIVNTKIYLYFILWLDVIYLFINMLIKNMNSTIYINYLIYNSISLLITPKNNLL